MNLLVTIPITNNKIVNFQLKIKNIIVEITNKMELIFKIPCIKTEVYINGFSPKPNLLTLPCIETKPQSNKYRKDNK